MYNYEFEKLPILNLKKPFGNKEHGKAVDYSIVLEHNGQYILNVTFEDKRKQTYDGQNIRELGNIIEKIYWEKASDVPKEDIKWMLLSVETGMGEEYRKYNVICELLGLDDGGICVSYGVPTFIEYKHIKELKYIDINGNEKECLCTA